MLHRDAVNKLLDAADDEVAKLETLIADDKSDAQIVAQYEVLLTAHANLVREAKPKSVFSKLGIAHSALVRMAQSPASYEDLIAAVGALKATAEEVTTLVNSLQSGGENGGTR